MRRAALGLGVVAGLCAWRLMMAEEGDELVNWASGDDKLQHVAAFAAISFLFSVGRGVRALRLTWVALVCAGLVLETLQPILTQTREASLLDAAANAVGVCLGLACAVSCNAFAQALTPMRVQP